MLAMTLSTAAAAAGVTVMVLAGLAGVAAWLVGSVRKSVADAQRDTAVAQADTIAALQAQVSTMRDDITALQAEVRACEDRDREKGAALKVLMDQARGTDQLQAIGAQITEAVKTGGGMQSELVAAFRSGQKEILEALHQIQYRLEVHA